MTPAESNGALERIEELWPTPKFSPQARVEWQEILERYSAEAVKLQTTELLVTSSSRRPPLSDFIGQLMPTDMTFGPTVTYPPGTGNQGEYELNGRRYVKATTWERAQREHASMQSLSNILASHTKPEERIRKGAMDAGRELRALFWKKQHEDGDVACTFCGEAITFAQTRQFRAWCGELKYGECAIPPAGSKLLFCDGCAIEAINEVYREHGPTRLPVPNEIDVTPTGSATLHGDDELDPTKWGPPQDSPSSLPGKGKEIGHG